MALLDQGEPLTGSLRHGLRPAGCGVHAMENGQSRSTFHMFYGGDGGRSNRNLVFLPRRDPEPVTLR